MLAECDAAFDAIASGAAALSDDTRVKPFPSLIMGATLPTGLALLHMSTHLAYHLGQIDFHRRLVSGQFGEVKALSVSNWPP